jgi:hypothetical protein
VLLIVGILVVAAAEDDSDSDNAFSRLAAWMTFHGGRVDPRLDVTTLGDDGIRGGVALADILEGEELFHCPWKLVIGSSGETDQMQQGQGMCAVIRKLETELRLGKESLWYPYLALDDSLINSRLPAVWDESIRLELQGLPPSSEDATRHLRWFAEDCNNGEELLIGSGGDDDEDDSIFTQQALFSFVTRASAVGMVPIYDLLNHHNGMRNVKLLVSPEGVQLTAIRPIPAGDQIFLSYGVKSSSTMFRDYGFVESWPQIWTWTTTNEQQDRHTFVLFPDQAAAIYPTPEFLKSFWRSFQSLDSFQAKARQHNQEQLSSDSLRAFGMAAQRLLASLPTSWQEDKVLLMQLLLLLKDDETTKNNDDIEKQQQHLDDRIRAVEYRMSFKEAVQSALEVSEVALLKDFGQEL